MRTHQPKITEYLTNNRDATCPTTSEWGHSLREIDCTTTLHILLQNPTGIKLGKTSILDFDHSLQLCHDLGVGHLCLTEMNVNCRTSYPKLMQQLNEFGIPLLCRPRNIPNTITNNTNEEVPFS
jgi:hypothetical protein